MLSVTCLRSPLPTPADCLYVPGLLERAIELARGAGACVALELASFEVVRAFSEVRCWERGALPGLAHTGQPACACPSP